MVSARERKSILKHLNLSENRAETAIFQPQATVVLMVLGFHTCNASLKTE